MRHRSNHIALAFVSVFAVSLFAYAQLGGPDGVRIPYRGTLNAAGTAVNGPHDFRFTVFNVPTAGAPCDSHTETTLVTDGAFSVVLGPVDESCVRGQDIYLGIEVSPDAGADGYTALAGRQRIHTAASAASSGSGDFSVEGDLGVSGAISAASVTTSSVTASSVSGGAITGASAITTGNIEAASAEIGEVGYGPDWAGFSHKNAGPNNYALLQDINTNVTVLNSNTSGNIEFRFGNVARGGIDFNGTLTSSSGTSVGAAERLGIVRGTVNGNGTVNRGVGYTVSHPATGVFDITFTNPFASNPTVTCVAVHPSVGLQGGGAGQCMPSHPNNTNASFVRLIVANGGDGNSDFPFSFIAIGPR